MASLSPLKPLLLLLLLLLSVAAGERRRTYIVHMNAANKPSIHETHADWYRAHLLSLSISPSDHLLYTYTVALHGFAASLLPHHLPLLRRHPSVLHLHPDPLLPLHTTRSPLFLGLLSSPPITTAAESASRDLIIGLLDTGVWPESPSFSDSSLPPIPSRWRGSCEPGVDFPPSLCNRKLIGARSFSHGFRSSSSSSDRPHEYDSARDLDGHGTHTASTAAGGAVSNASLLGYASGTARGMAPSARIAVYKVCWAAGCFGSDIAAGMDSALSDGVDVLSLSLGGGSSPYFHDTIAIAAFAAVQRGIFVSCSAGNSGPGAATLANAAPWIATVGAGTLDRDFPADVKIGSGRQVLTGVSLYSGKGMGRRMVPLVYGAAAGGGGNATAMCMAGSLDPAKVKGKVVLCDRGVSARVEKGEVVRAAGGKGMVLANTLANGEEMVADSHLLPAVAVGRKDGDRIRRYTATARKATAVLGFRGTVVGVRPSPVVAAFSSRGPNAVTPEILKPDMIGPGVNILAGWSGAVGPTGLAKDQRRAQFNIMSGTSMSCPHISGVAALLKAAHPGWSPSAIKSALMTTAYSVDNTGSVLRDAAGGSLATPYAYGAGHVDPQKALSPGLVYDIAIDDYIAFLCSLNYTTDHVKAIAKQPNVTCSRRLSDPGNLNYPSFSVVFTRLRRVVKYTREVTNVGRGKSVYSVKVGGSTSVSVTVKPRKLAFRYAGEKLKYSVMFASKREGKPRNAEFGWINWSNKQHNVQSPIAYTWRFS